MVSIHLVEHHLPIMGGNVLAMYMPQSAVVNMPARAMKKLRGRTLAGSESSIMFCHCRSTGVLEDRVADEDGTSVE